MAKHERFHIKTLDQLEAEARRLGIELPVEQDISILLEPVKVGSLMTPNRSCVLPMDGFDADPSASPQELTFRRYRRYAAGGFGIIWFEATVVVPEARSNPGQLHFHPGNVLVFKKVVDETRKVAQEHFGSNYYQILILQLTHSGR